MLAAMNELAEMWMVLSATAQGEPFCRKLGFETAMRSTWWQTAGPRQA